MKKILLSFFALTLLSTTSVFANGGKKKAKKAKTTCTKTCTDKKDCKMTANCAPMPGCCKM